MQYRIVFAITYQDIGETLEMPWSSFGRTKDAAIESAKKEILNQVGEEEVQTIEAIEAEVIGKDL